ncbi:hypothetical protein MKW94_017374 [Papaver nudicaule]|uniref:Fatty acyl-CoA reductase n=1 Tax=Papaver nudicaule TaxID=74823 RepID=A0AA41VGB2_PAPNU|nr:hypothetical protein [Papaver nudicaule]
MELNGIVQSLENKSILLTGSTGFLSKLFVEKLLRVQPNMKQLFLLLRPADISSATQRLHNEEKKVFRELRKKHGNGFDSFISKMVTPVFGDVDLENLGIKDFVLKDKMHKQLDIVANFVATTSLDERYDHHKYGYHNNFPTYIFMSLEGLPNFNCMDHLSFYLLLILFFSNCEFLKDTMWR